MPRRIHLEHQLTLDELERRYQEAPEPHERSWFQILWLLAPGQTATAIAESTGYSRYCIGQVARRFNQNGPAGMRNRRYTHSYRAQPLLSTGQLAELAAVAREVGAGPRKQMALVLDRAGWHTSLHLRAPAHAHLLFLPASSPELQSAEHLGALTNTVLANRHFASIDDREDAQAARCVAPNPTPTSFARRRSSIGGHSASRNDKDRDEISMNPDHTESHQSARGS